VTTSVIGLFDDAQEAQQAVRDLQNSSLANCRITTNVTADQLSGMGISADDLDTYRHSLRRGGTIVCVQTPDKTLAERAETILDRDGAIDVDQIASWVRTAPEGNTLHEIREQLHVGKEVVQSGGVRVRTYITEQPVNQEVTLRQEQVNVQRTPVDKPADPRMLDNSQERTIEVTASEEVPVVNKEARITEEVTVNKTASQRTEQIGETLREKHVEVQPIGSTDFDQSYWEREHRTMYTGDTWNTYQPAYRYGWTMANDPAYRGRQWNEVETDLRTRWERDNPNSWERFKDSIRHAWDRTTGAGVRATGPAGGVAYADNPPRDNMSGVESETEDTRGFFEKIADAITGDDTDDKTGKKVE
jgi:uncharacterized protein (TIGR02271 family)